MAREAKAVAIAEEAKSRGDPLEDPKIEDDVDEDMDVTELEPKPQTQAEIMATERSRTYLRRTRRTIAGSTDIEMIYVSNF